MPSLVRGKKYQLDEILKLVRDPAVERATLDGTPGTVNVKSLRLRMFAEIGTTCVVCKLAGAFFASEIHMGKKAPKDVSYHLNLYALDADGKEVLMTKDHIIPASKGGRDVLKNMQPMCCMCNSKKGDKIQSTP